MGGPSLLTWVGGTQWWAQLSIYSCRWVRKQVLKPFGHDFEKCVSWSAFLTLIYFNVSWCLSQSVSQSVQLCPTLCDPMDCSMLGFPAHHQLLSLFKLMSIESVMPSNHLILCHPLLLLPSIFPSIMVLSNESVFCIRWPKYWSFSFSISPSNEYPGLISFRIDWFDLLAVHETLNSLL